MGLNMYHGETEAQRNSMNAVCIELIQAMEQTKASIHAFALSFDLRGKTYQTAKTYMTEMYLPLAQGIIYLCEELIRQNDRFPSEFKAAVSPMDVSEEEVHEQLREVERIRVSLEQMDGQLAVFGLTIPVYERLENELRKRLDELYDYDYGAVRHYDTAVQLAGAIAQGLAQLEYNSGFDLGSGTFTTGRINMEWSEKIEAIHYQRKAKEAFPEHLRANPHDLEKLGAILQYEAIHPDKVEDTDHMLEPLELKDAVGIKYLMYTAEEPYRSLALKYVEAIQIDRQNDNTPARFTHEDNTIHFNPEIAQSNTHIVDYSPFFHALGHAVDYNHGQALDWEGLFSEHFQTEGRTLAEHMQRDVEAGMQVEPDAEGFARYFGMHFAAGSEDAAGEGKETGEDKLVSEETDLPKSKEHMDEMIKEMIK